MERRPLATPPRNAARQFVENWRSGRGPVMAGTNNNGRGWTEVAVSLSSCRGPHETMVGQSSSETAGILSSLDAAYGGQIAAESRPSASSALSTQVERQSHRICRGQAIRRAPVALRVEVDRLDHIVRSSIRPAQAQFTLAVERLLPNSGRKSLGRQRKLLQRHAMPPAADPGSPSCIAARPALPTPDTLPPTVPAPPAALPAPPALADPAPPAPVPPALAPPAAPALAPPDPALALAPPPAPAPAPPAPLRSLQRLRLRRRLPHQPLPPLLHLQR